MKLMGFTNDQREPMQAKHRFAPRSCLSMALALACLAALLLGPTASAHVIMGGRSLHLQLVEADLVVRARVIRPMEMFTYADGKKKRRLVAIEILETLKGKAGDETLRFAQVGHATARYKTNQEALFFLKPIETSRELRVLAIPGGPSHVSNQESHGVFITDGPYSSALLSAARELIASESATKASERVAMIRSATLNLLTSGDTHLGGSALASLVLAPHAELITKKDLPRLKKFIANPDVSIGLRIGLVSELERRKLLDGSSYRLKLLENAKPNELRAAIRAAGARPSKAIDAFLITSLANPDLRVEIRSECAVALGRPENTAAIQALLEALTHKKPRLRNAAIRGLSAIHGDEAYNALKKTAQSHPSRATRAHANAEVRTRDRYRKATANE